MDFIMFEHAASGLKPSTTQGEVIAVRYYRVVNGWPDFTTSGPRYKLPTKTLRAIAPACRELPYIAELITWVKRNFSDIGKGMPRANAIWEALDLSFFSPYVVSKWNNLDASN